MAVKELQSLYTLKDLAKILSKSPTNIYHNWHRWVNEGRLKVLFVGGRPRFQQKSVEKLIKSFEI